MGCPKAIYQLVLQLVICVSKRTTQGKLSLVEIPIKKLSEVSLNKVF